jgi:hypothetical protein
MFFDRIHLISNSIRENSIYIYIYICTILPPPQSTDRLSKLPPLINYCKGQRYDEYPTGFI